MKKRTYPRKGSKLYRLLKYLQTHITVTAMDIIDAIPTTTPSSLLYKLRHRYGFNIVCKLIINPDGSRFGLYTLMP